MPASQRSRTPDRAISPTTSRTRTIITPRSGSAATSRIGTAPRPSVLARAFPPGLAPAVRARAAGWDSSIALITITDSFANSLGSIWKPAPSEIHDLAPLTIVPTGVSTASRPRQDSPYTTGASRRSWRASRELTTSIRTSPSAMLSSCLSRYPCGFAPWASSIGWVADQIITVPTRVSASTVASSSQSAWRSGESRPVALAASRRRASQAGLDLYRDWPLTQLNGAVRGVARPCRTRRVTARPNPRPRAARPDPGAAG